MVTILPRSTWTSTAPGFPKHSGRLLVPHKVEEIHLHYPGDGNVIRRGGSLATTCGLLRAYRNYHVNTRGWADIGYCLAIDQEGRILMAAGTSHAAAHSASPLRPNENFRSLGFLLLLGNNEAPSAAMIASINALWAEMRVDFPNLRLISMHRDVPGASTACAGPHVAKLLQAKAFSPIRTAPIVGPAARPIEEIQAILSHFDAYTLGDKLQWLDGVNGPATTAGIIAYQQRRGLTPDGWWYTNTENYFRRNDMSQLIDAIAEEVEQRVISSTNGGRGQYSVWTMLTRVYDATRSTSAQLREVAGKVGAAVDAEELAGLLAPQLAEALGDIDEEKVTAALRTVFADAAAGGGGDDA